MSDDPGKIPAVDFTTEAAMDTEVPLDRVEASDDPRMSDVDGQQAGENLSNNDVGDGEKNEQQEGFFKKKRKDMTPQEKEEEKQRKSDYKKRKRAEDKMRGEYTAKSSFAHVIRYPERKAEKITLSVYRAMLRDLAGRNARHILTAGRLGQTVIVEDSALETARWVQHGDRAAAKSKEAWNRHGHMFLGFDSKQAKEHFEMLIRETVTDLRVKTIVLNDEDNRAVFTVSVITDLYEGLGKTDATRRAEFMELLSYNQHGDFPRNGSEIVTSFLKPSDPDYTILVIRATPEWAAGATSTPTRKSGVGQLRFFERPKREVQKEINGATDAMAEQLAHLSTQPPASTSGGSVFRSATGSMTQEPHSYADAAKPTSSSRRTENSESSSSSRRDDPNKTLVDEPSTLRAGMIPASGELPFSSSSSQDLETAMAGGPPMPPPPPPAPAVKTKKVPTPQSALNKAPPIVLPAVPTTSGAGTLDGWVTKKCSVTLQRARNDSAKSSTSVASGTSKTSSSGRSSSSAAKRTASASPANTGKKGEPKKMDKKPTPDKK